MTAPGEQSFGAGHFLRWASEQVSLDGGGVGSCFLTLSTKQIRKDVAR